ncbi:hypothetical protein BDW71DRAFT_153419 [Aspergillus fruticulosus]
MTIVKFKDSLLDSHFNFLLSWLWLLGGNHILLLRIVPRIVPASSGTCRFIFSSTVDILSSSSLSNDRNPKYSSSRLLLPLLCVWRLDSVFLTRKDMMNVQTTKLG